MSEQIPTNSRIRPGSAAHIDDEIDLLDLALVLAKNKKMIVTTTAVAALLTIIISLIMPSIYTAQTVILPPQQQSSATAMLASQLGALSGMGGSLGIKNPNDTYVAMLKSRTIADSLIERFDLQQDYEAETMTDTRKRLESVTTVTSGKDNLITVSVDDRDPKRAADLANAYIDELRKLNQVLAVSEASQRRLFYEKQLQETKRQLSNAEIALKQIQEKTGLIELDAQASSLVQATASIRAQIAMKEVQLGAMRTFATSQNPDYVRIRKEIEGLSSQLSKVETGSVTASNAPEAGLEYIRKVRDVKYYEMIYKMLAQQFEVAKLDEAKDASIIQVLDTAIPPEKRSLPKRALMVIIGTIAGGFLAVLWAFVSEVLAKANEDAEDGERLRQLRQQLRWK